MNNDRLREIIAETRALLAVQAGAVKKHSDEAFRLRQIADQVEKLDAAALEQDANPMRAAA
ncbi:hypothetical protein ACFB49_45860 [Sphingomonas sp. DBB INV C78]|uniref:hypothetical protein n=1 Tax=Sphingomonas sp. DBB INV C78 TaxID=3349434 RepID=UPI0036D3977F